MLSCPMAYAQLKVDSPVKGHTKENLETTYTVGSH